MNFSQKGFEVFENCIDPNVFDSLKRDLNDVSLGQSQAGVRNIEVSIASVRRLTHAESLLGLADELLGGQAQFVRAILFDKSHVNNWMVSWHQDKTIAVKNKRDIAGWGPWSIKEGRYHVQPSEDVLKSMVTFRIHIDASTVENGCLRVIPGSHRYGILSQGEIDMQVRSARVAQCPAGEGTIMAMRPLLIHSSSKAKRPSSRRVLHVEYSHYPLPYGLSWA